MFLDALKEISWVLRARLHDRGSEVCLTDGWHGLEIGRVGFFRWSSKLAKLEVEGPRLGRVRLRLYSQVPTHCTIRVGGEPAAEAEVHGFVTVELEVGGADRAELEIEVDRTWSSGDSTERELGVSFVGLRFDCARGERRASLRQTRKSVRTVVVATSRAPFEDSGGNVYMAETLARQLRLAGFRSTVFYTPQNPHYLFWPLLRGYLANAASDLANYDDIDLVISLRYPSYAIRHPNHVTWLTHRQREFYDLWQSREPHWPARVRLWRRLQRPLIHALDRYLLRRRQRVFALSANVQARLQRWGKIDSRILHMPAVSDQLYCGRNDPYILTVSRLAELKRIHLLIAAMARLDDPEMRCVIVGTGPQQPHLARLISEHQLDHRVELYGFAEDAQLTELYAHCRAVFFGPYDEDFGLVTVEAMKSSKPVITCADSGGPLELVRHQVNGLVVEPEAAAIAQAIDHLASDPENARSLGEQGYETVRRITWQRVIEQLTSTDRAAWATSPSEPASSDAKSNSATPLKPAMLSQKDA